MGCLSCYLEDYATNSGNPAKLSSTELKMMSGIEHIANCRGKNPMGFIRFLRNGKYDVGNVLALDSAADDYLEDVNLEHGRKMAVKKALVLMVTFMPETMFDSRKGHEILLGMHLAQLASTRNIPYRPDLSDFEQARLPFEIAAEQFTEQYFISSGNPKIAQFLVDCVYRNNLHSSKIPEQVKDAAG